ncbi:MAG: hypothetical protein WCG63_01915 [Opitutaceae bacterium]
MKRGFPPFTFEAAVIASIIVKPEAKKAGRHNPTVKNSGADEIKHGFELGLGAVGGARISINAPLWSAISMQMCLRGYAGRYLKNKKTRRQ